jgi:hypothetical protein
MTRPPVLLLGAGASKDAGIPISTEMTEKLVAVINERPFIQEAQALNFVCGALMAHDSAGGASPYTGLDVERVFAAVMLLAERRDLEVTPFVASWDPAVDAWDRARAPSFFGSNLKQALERSGGAHRIDQLMASFVDARTGVGEGATYRSLARAMIGGLRPLLETAADRCAYLAPIGQASQRPAGLTVATLNYDTSVEQATAAIGASAYTGIDSWASERAWRWPDNGLRLMKLHGSIDWHWETVRGDPGQLSVRRVVRDADDDPEPPDPALVFGQRSKLTAEGPFLSLLAEFERHLDATDHLIVIGYSFRDEHVNVVIRRWVAEHRDSTITIVDPSLSGPPARFGPGNRVGALRSHGRPDFRSELLLFLNSPAPPGARSRPPRVEAIGRTAREALAEMFATPSSANRVQTDITPLDATRADEQTTETKE